MSGDDKKPDAKKLDRLRVAADVPVKIIIEMLGVTRATYYSWVKKNSFRKDKYTRITLTMTVLAMGLRDGKLPIKDLTGAEKEAASKRVVREILSTLRKK